MKLRIGLWILCLVGILQLTGCYGSGDLGLTAPDAAADTDTDTEWSLEVFDCDRACEVERECMLLDGDVPPDQWGACIKGCRDALDLAETPSELGCIECLWTDCVLPYEAGNLPCTEWVACVNHCCQGAWDDDAGEILP